VYILYIQYNVPASKYNSMLYSIVNVSCVTLLQIPAQIFERAVYLYPSFSSKESPGGILLSFLEIKTKKICWINVDILNNF
jgi:hypothetical protein